MGKIVDKFVSSELDKCPGDRRLCQGCSLWAKERRKTGRRKPPVQQPQGVICDTYVAGGMCSVHTDKDWICGSKPCVFRKRTPVR